MSYNMQPVQQTSTMQKVAVIVPAFLVGMVGAMALTAPQQVAVQHRVLPQAGMVAGAVAAGMVATAFVMALNDIALSNDMDKTAGVMYTYEARDRTLPQDVRSGFSDRDPAYAKTRLGESVARLSNVGDAINKKYWTEGREELRRQVGYMRFDLNTLAASKGGASAKGSALAAKKDLFETIDKLDFAMRMKDQATAAKVFADVTAKATAIAGSF
jgi:photosystem II oxygen-evolving enhancer protein 3